MGEQERTGVAGGAGGSRGRAVVAVWDRLSRQDLVFGFGTLGKLAVCGLNAVVCQKCPSDYPGPGDSYRVAEDVKLNLFLGLSFFLLLLSWLQFLQNLKPKEVSADLSADF